MFTKRFLSALIGVFALLAIQTVPAHAFATANQVSLSCSSLSVSGTTNQPYVTLYVYNYSLDKSFHTIIAASGGSYSGTLDFPDAATGTLFDVVIWGSPDLWTTSADPGYYDHETYFENDLTACSSDVPGPAIPDGFVLRHLTCSTAVFDTPGGSPVGDNAVYAGQSFYINPTPVVANGKSWTEIFVSGWTNPFIPTACIGG